MKKWLALITCISMMACADNSPHNKGLQHTKLVKQYFNKYQKADLEKILAFFESQICEPDQTSPENIFDCYNNYLAQLAENSAFGNLDPKISLEEQDTLINNLHKVTYTSIWSDGKTNTSATPNGLFGLKYGDRYHRFLSALGKENEKIKQYEATFQKTGTITPSMIADVLVNYTEYDLTDLRVRLVIAIHYLTLNRTFSENEQSVN